MPKIRNDSYLSDNPDNIINASKFIQTIALKNMDNRAEEPTLKPIDTKSRDEIEVSFDEFNDKIVQIDSFLTSSLSIQSALLTQLKEVYGDNFVGAGRYKRGKSLSGYSLPKLPTAETHKGRYWKNMRDFPYQVKGAGFEGKLKGRMRGGADNGADFDLGLDEEDEEDEQASFGSFSLPSSQFTEGTIHTPEPSWNEFDPPAGYQSLADTSNPSSVTDEGEYIYDPEISVQKLIDNLLRAYTNAKTAKTYFDSKLRNKFNDLPRLKVQQLTDSKQLLSQIEDVYRNLTEDNDIEYFSFLPSKYEKGLTEAYKRLDKVIPDLLNDVDRSIDSYAEKRRTGAGMSGGARGGVPILSSIQQYQRIPTKYML